MLGVLNTWIPDTWWGINTWWAAHIHCVEPTYIVAWPASPLISICQPLTSTYSRPLTCITGRTPGFGDVALGKPSSIRRIVVFTLMRAHTTSTECGTCSHALICLPWAHDPERGLVGRRRDVSHVVRTVRCQGLTG